MAGQGHKVLGQLLTSGLYCEQLLLLTLSSGRAGWAIGDVSIVSVTPEWWGIGDLGPLGKGGNVPGTCKSPPTAQAEVRGYGEFGGLFRRWPRRGNCATARAPDAVLAE